MATKSPNRGTIFNRSISSHNASTNGIVATSAASMAAASAAAAASKPPPPIRRSSSISSQDAQDMMASRMSSFRGGGGAGGHNEDDEATPHGSLENVSIVSPTQDRLSLEAMVAKASNVASNLVNFDKQVRKHY